MYTNNMYPRGSSRLVSVLYIIHKTNKKLCLKIFV